MPQPVSQYPYPAKVAGARYKIRRKGSTVYSQEITVQTKAMPLPGDNLLWKEDPDTLYGQGMSPNENNQDFFANGNMVTTGYMQVAPGMDITASINLFAGNYYNASKQYIARWNPAYRITGTAPANAAFFRATFDGVGNFLKGGIFVGKWGTADNNLFRPEPYPGPWNQDVELPAARTRSQWNVQFLGVVGSTTKDPNYSVFPESGYNGYGDVAAAIAGMVCAKRFNENAPILVVHPWDGINQRRALYTNINGECPFVASNGTHCFAVVNGNDRATYTQKWIAVFDVATQQPFEVTGGNDLVGYGNDNEQVGFLSKAMAWEGYQVPNPNTGNNDDWKYQRELFINTWKYTGIAAEQGLNKLVAVSCDMQALITIRRFPDNAVVDTIDVAHPRRMAFTPDGSLWVCCGEDYAVNFKNRTDTTLRKFQNQGTAQAPNFQQVASYAIPFLSSVMGESDNGVLVGISGTRQQYVKLSSSGVEQSSHGQAGGNVTSAIVTDTTYELVNREPLQDGDQGQYVSFSCRAPDGSIWLGDPGNYQIKHWNAGMSTHIKADRIGYLPDFFDLALDKGDKNRLYTEKIRLTVPWPNIRAAEIDRNYNSLLDTGYHLSPHSVLTYTSQNGVRKCTVGLFQDIRFHDGAPNPRPDGTSVPGYKCEMIALPADGSDPVFSGQWFDFEPNVGRTWTLYPEGIRTFENYRTGPDNTGDWRTRVLFRAFVDLSASPLNGQYFPVFGAQVTLLDELTQLESQPGTKPVPVPGWNRQYTCPMFPNGAFAGMETAYRPLGAFHLGYLKPGVTGWWKLLLPNKYMRDEFSQGFYPDITTDLSFGGHFTAGNDIAGILNYSGQDGQFSEKMSNQTIVHDQDGNFIIQFGRLQDEGPGFKSQNMDAYAYGNNCGQIRALELDNGNHIVVRATENSGGPHAYLMIKPTQLT